MTCTDCKYWKYKPDANGYCTCLWPSKPCEQTRRYKAKQKRNKKKLEMYGKGAKKMRFYRI